MFENQTERKDLKFDDKQWKRHKHQNLSRRLDPEETDHMQSYNQIIKFFAILGKFFGTRISYDWEPKRYFMYWFTFVLLGISSFHIIYSIFYHYRRGDYMRIIEPFAVSGMMVSVMDLKKII